MLISEIKNKNDVILKRAQAIEKILHEDENLHPNTPIEFSKNAFLYYTATASLTAQAKAPMGEKFLCNILGMERVSSREGRGDAVDSKGLYYEFKNSFTNQAENLNIRQIRLWQNVDFYYCIYINEVELDKSLFFVLSKEEMIEEVALCGGFTHGTVEANKNNVNNEYSITIPVYKEKNEKTKRWKQKYLSEELKLKVLGGSQ